MVAVVDAASVEGVGDAGIASLVDDAAESLDGARGDAAASPATMAPDDVDFRIIHFSEVTGLVGVSSTISSMYFLKSCMIPWVFMCLLKSWRHLTDPWQIVQRSRLFMCFESM